MKDTSKILIVIDGPHIRDSLKLLLQRQGYNISTADSGKEALRLIAAHTFDLLLLDLAISDMNGYQILDYMNSCQNDLLTIVITGNDSIASAVTALRKGAYDYLKKPFKYEELLKRVGNALQQKKLSSERQAHLIKEKKLMREKESLEKNYIKKLICPQVFQELNAGKDLSPQNEDIVVGFVDIRGFTKLTNNLEISQLNVLLEYFFEMCAEIISTENGILDKFIGDSAMWFHRESSLKKSADKCINVSIKIMKSLNLLDKKLNERLHIKIKTNVGIGIACGNCAVGIFGSKRYRIQYSVLGPAVNLASRLCSEAKSNDILLGGEVIEYCSYKTRKVGFRLLKGFEHEVEIRKIVIPNKSIKM